jgi:hypothetical protein
VIGFYDLPVADVPLHNRGLTPEQATAVLGTLAAAPGFAGSRSASSTPTTASRTAPPPAR